MRCSRDRCNLLQTLEEPLRRECFLGVSAGVNIAVRNRIQMEGIDSRQGPIHHGILLAQGNMLSANNASDECI